MIMSAGKVIRGGWCEFSDVKFSRERRAKAAWEKEIHISRGLIYIFAERNKFPVNLITPLTPWTSLHYSRAEIRNAYPMNNVLVPRAQSRRHILSVEPTVRSSFQIVLADVSPG